MFRLAFNPDDTSIVVVADDSTARIFSLEGEQLAILPGHKRTVSMASFSPDGKRIITASYDGTARQHLVAFDDLLAAAACRTTRLLSEEELRRYDIPAPLKLEQPGCVEARR